MLLKTKSEIIIKEKNYKTPPSIVQRFLK